MENTIQISGAHSLSIYRWKDSHWIETDDVIAEEVLISVRLDDRIYGSLVCSPWNLEELVTGYLFTEGVIRCREDISTIRITEDTACITLQAGRSVVEQRRCPPCSLTPSAVLRLIGALEDGSTLFHHTGGVHSAALSDGTRILIRCEDVGRHNALDRLVGRCLMDGIPLSGQAVVFSGRVPDEIIRKVIHAGCSAIISVSAPTSLAVETAKQAGILLIAFARGNRFNVYAHPELLAQDPSEASPHPIKSIL